MTKGLARTLRSDEIECYREHGVVHLRGLLRPDLVDRIREAFEVTMSSHAEGIHHLDLVAVAKGVEAAGVELLDGDAEPSGRFWVRTFNWMKIPELESLGTASPFAEVAADLMGADRICFFGDQLFLKDPGSMHRTAFHQDGTYFHHEGDQCCTIWMPLDVVDRENGAMGYVRGSHRWPLHSPNLFVSQSSIPGATGAPLPDIEGNEGEYDIVYYDSEPGDAIVHHVRTAHGSTGNTSANRIRRALALRYLGDDIHYLERQGAPPDSQKSETLHDGDPIASPDFPQIWTKGTGYQRL